MRNPTCVLVGFLACISLMFGLAGAAARAETRAAPPAARGGWLGVYLGPADLLVPEEDDTGDTGEAREPIADAPSGAVVTFVVKDSPADRAGVRGGDLVLRLGAAAVTAPADLQRAVSTLSVGEWAELEILRDSQRRTVSVQLGERPEEASGGELRRPWVGASTLTVPLQLRTYWGGSETRGVLVGEVTAGGPADRAGLRPGDLVLRAGGHSIPSPAEFTRRVQLGGVGNRIDVEISRQGTPMTLEMDLEDAPATERGQAPGAPGQRVPGATGKPPTKGTTGSRPNSGDK